MGLFTSPAVDHRVGHGTRAHSATRVIGAAVVTTSVSTRNSPPATASHDFVWGTTRRIRARHGTYSSAVALRQKRETVPRLVALLGGR
jgi:hypothetical protein